jgi:ABC-type tungstate transport system permease subunit
VEGWKMYKTKNTGIKEGIIDYINHIFDNKLKKIIIFKDEYYLCDGYSFIKINKAYKQLLNLEISSLNLCMDIFTEQSSFKIMNDYEIVDEYVLFKGNTSRFSKYKFERILCHM